MLAFAAASLRLLKSRARASSAKAVFRTHTTHGERTHTTHRIPHNTQTLTTPHIPQPQPMPTPCRHRQTQPHIATQRHTGTKTHTHTLTDPRTETDRDRHGQADRHTGTQA